MAYTTISALLKFSSLSVLITTSSSTMLKVTTTPSRGLITRRILVYSRYITFNRISLDNSFLVPYLGVTPAIRNITILDTKEGSNYLVDSATNGHI